METADPKEGVVLWVDAWFMPLAADNVDTAEAYMNMALDPKVQAEVAMSLAQAPVSKKALEFMDEKARSATTLPILKKSLLLAFQVFRRWRMMESMRPTRIG